MPQPQSVARRVTENRRRYERSAVSLDGRLFVPAEDGEQPCQVADLSAGSARVICDELTNIVQDFSRGFMSQDRLAA